MHIAYAFQSNSIVAVAFLSSCLIRWRSKVPSLSILFQFSTRIFRSFFIFLRWIVSLFCGFILSSRRHIEVSCVRACVCVFDFLLAIQLIAFKTIHFLMAVNNVGQRQNSFLFISVEPQWQVFSPHVLSSYFLLFCVCCCFLFVRNSRSPIETYTLIPNNGDRRQMNRTKMNFQNPWIYGKWNSLSQLRNAS